MINSQFKAGKRILTIHAVNAVHSFPNTRTFMNLLKLTDEQLRFEFLSANKAYVHATFKREPSVYMKDKTFEVTKKHLDAIMVELRRRSGSSFSSGSSSGSSTSSSSSRSSGSRIKKK
jgi:uncharacterized membrane protein YgcG